MIEPFHNINQNEAENLLKLYECKEYEFKKNESILSNKYININNIIVLYFLFLQ